MVANNLLFKSFLYFLALLLVSCDSQFSESGIDNFYKKHKSIFEKIIYLSEEDTTINWIGRKSKYEKSESYKKMYNKQDSKTYDAIYKVMKENKLQIVEIVRDKKSASYKASSFIIEGGWIELRNVATEIIHLANGENINHFISPDTQCRPIELPNWYSCRIKN